MSKHNNSLGKSTHARCRCGRSATIEEWQAGIGIVFFYECPDCYSRRYSTPINRDDYYRMMGIKQ